METEGATLTDECAEERLTLHERITFAFDCIYRRCRWVVRPIWCLLTRHDVAWGDYSTGEPSYCKHCWREDPDEEHTLWNLANNSYGFLVEHAPWFERIDVWLSESKWQRWLPSWWEY